MAAARTPSAHPRRDSAAKVRQRMLRIMARLCGWKETARRPIGFFAGVCLVGALLFALAPASGATPYFRITVVDQEMGRGIPGVKLTTTNQAVFVTDSAGVVAFYRPDLMGKQVWFYVESPGYTYPPDYFGFQGINPVTTPGGSVIVSMQRQNIAQRLYRVTGVGIYRDSALLGDTVPAMQAPSDFPVMTQRNGESLVYNGKILWMGNDARTPDSLAGNLKATCATSTPPSQGGYDSNTGVYLEYFRQGEAIKPMIDIGYEIVRGGCLRVARDDAGSERLVANYYRLDANLNVIERGLVKFDDQAERFDKILTYPANSVILPDGIALRYVNKGMPYFYYVSPWPNVRSATELTYITTLGSYQAFTCLKQGSRLDYSAAQLDRDAQGNLRWGWATNTSPVGEKECATLVQRGLIAPDESWCKLTDVETGTRVRSDTGTVYWNERRGRWISIRGETSGKTPRGEIWYFEGDTPLGPWVYGRKILTHYIDSSNNYSFLFPAHHPELDRSGGQVIYFDGTLTNDLAATRFPLPSYNGNRIMYRMNLDDNRLYLPVPVYRVGGSVPVHRTKLALSDHVTDRTPIFFAPDQPLPTAIYIYEYPDPEHNTVILSASTSSPTGQPGTFVFFAISKDASIPPASSLALTVPLNEFIHQSTQTRLYTTEDTVAESGYVKSAAPVCRVWPNPIRFNPYKLAPKQTGPNQVGAPWWRME